MPFITLDQTRYHFIERNKESAALPYVLLHGFTGCAENWAEVMRPLAQHGRVLAIDLPGHGFTQAPDDVSQFTLPVVSQQVAALIAAVIGRPVHLLGYSMGGRLALQIALDYAAQVQRLTLESASPGLADAGERVARITSDEGLAERITRNGIAAFVSEWERLPLWASQGVLADETRARLRTQRLQNNVNGLALSLRGMGTGAQAGLWHRLGEFRLPTLLLAGELDPKFVAIARRMAADIPTSRLHIVPRAGHTTHLEQPEEFVAAILA